MNKKEKILVIDVETANSTDCPLVYDIGYAVVDNTGHVYTSDSFVIYDIFVCERELMQSAYYRNKIPEYEVNLTDGYSRLVRFDTARRIIKEVMQEYKITTVGAYNCYFDKNRLNNTLRYLTKSKQRWFFPYGTEFICIWSMACQVICTQPTYIKWAIGNNFVSPTGNIVTNAETVYKYITKNVDFCEEHKGLDDVLIENKIFAHCIRQHKKVDKSINRTCWRIPQQVRKKLKIA